MTEEEKKAIEELKSFKKDKDCKYWIGLNGENAIDIILNLIEKQQKEIELNREIVEVAQTQILEYLQGYKDGLNKETTATAIVAREVELNFIRQEIKRNYISKDKIREKYLKMEQEYCRKVYDNNYDRTEVKKEEMYKRQVYNELLEEYKNEE